MVAVMAGGITDGVNTNTEFMTGPDRGKALQRWFPYALYALLSLSALWQLLLPGTIFTLDMGFPPEVDPFKAFAGLEFGIISGIASLFVIELSRYVIPLWIIRKLILFFSFFLAGIEAHRLGPSGSHAGMLYPGFPISTCD